jgi:hypothetical protein
MGWLRDIQAQYDGAMTLRKTTLRLMGSDLQFNSIYQTTKQFKILLTQAKNENFLDIINQNQKYPNLTQNLETWSNLPKNYEN